MQIVIHGNGKMAKVIQTLMADTDHQVVAIIDPQESRVASIIDDYDVVIDFSHQLAIEQLIADLNVKPKPVVIATTNLTEVDKQAIKQLSEKCPVFQDYNTSYGIAAMCKLVEVANQLLGTDYDRTLIDRHHNTKVDSPSGTSFKLANRIDGELAINSIRAGGIFGEHSLSFTSKSEELTITHTAFNREVFGSGAIKVAEQIIRYENGLYNIESIYN